MASYRKTHNPRGMNMTNEPCTHEYLASGKSGKVLICRDCGVVHLHLQNLSLRLGVEQFAEFSALISAAATNLGDDAATSHHGRPKLTLVH